MKHVLQFGLTLLLASSAVAGTITLKSNDGGGDTDDMFDLDHYYYYTWGLKNVSAAIAPGEVITGASLTIQNINNWTASENNLMSQRLNVWLLDNAAVNGYVNQGDTPTGVLRRYSDTDNGADNFGTWAYGAKTFIGTYHDYSGGDYGDVINLTFNFSAAQVSALKTYITNGNNFALGFDPDCHYWNTGVCLTITTTRVPDAGASALLLALGLMALPFVKRRSK